MSNDRDKIAHARLEIRRAEPADLPDCAKIFNDWVDEVEWLSGANAAHEIAAVFGPDPLTSHKIWLASIDDRPLGFLSVSHKGWVQAIYLSPQGRGWGLGRQLMQCAMRLHSEGLELGVFEPNQGARQFFEKLGFHDVPQGPNRGPQNGMSKRVMRWKGLA